MKKIFNKNLYLNFKSDHYLKALYPINNIIEHHFGRLPSQIVKLTGGDINEVYQVFFQESPYAKVML